VPNDWAFSIRVQGHVRPVVACCYLDRQVVVGLHVHLSRVSARMSPPSWGVPCLGRERERARIHCLN
jgi:hypothetical protein